MEVSAKLSLSLLYAVMGTDTTLQQGRAEQELLRLSTHDPRIEGGRTHLDEPCDLSMVQHSGPCQGCSASKHHSQPGIIELAVPVHDLSRETGQGRQGALEVNL